MRPTVKMDDTKKRKRSLPGLEFRIVQSHAVLSKYSMNPFTLAIPSDIFVHLTIFLLYKKKL